MTMLKKTLAQPQKLGAKAEVTRLDSANNSARNRNRTTGTPRPRTCMLSRQVSWLAGPCCCPAFPKPIVVSVTLLDSGSPLTVAGAAPALAFFGRTGFPLSFGPNEPEEPRPLQLGSTA